MVVALQNIGLNSLAAIAGRAFLGETAAFTLAGAALVVMVVGAAGLIRRDLVVRRVGGQSNVAPEHFQLLFQLSQDLMCVANREGYFIRLNPMWQRVLGYSDAE